MKRRKFLYVILTLAVLASATSVVFAVNSAIKSRYVTRGTVTLTVAKPVAGVEFFVRANGSAVFNEFIYGDSPENPVSPIVTFKEKDGGVWITAFSDYNGFGDINGTVRLGTLIFENRSNSLTVELSDTAAYRLNENGSLTRVSVTARFTAEIPDEETNGGGGGGSEEEEEESPPPSEPPLEAPEPVSEYASVTFADLTESEWARTAIEYLASRYGFSGMGENMFAPNAELTRAQFARFTAVVFGIETTDFTARYSDVSDGDWFAADVNALSSVGAIDGFPDGTFRPEELITREQMAAIIIRTATALGLELAPMRPFILTDIDDAGEWARDAIRALYRSGVIEGLPDDRFAPRLPATRAQACAILYRIVRALNL